MSNGKKKFGKVDLNKPCSLQSQRYEPIPRLLHALNTFGEKFDTYNEQNRNLDEETKLSVLKVSSCVVAIGCVSLDLVFHFSACATVVKSIQTNRDTYLSTVITSASLFGGYSHKDFKAEVYTGNGNVFKVKDFEFDNHYNVALLRFESDSPIPTATLRVVDDSYKCSIRSFELRPHSEAFRLSQGEKVIAVGRFFEEPFDLMAAPGTFSLERCDFDCQQLRRTTCNISKCGIGGPLINLHGEVIGVNFYHENYTPFLPINIAMKCLENLEKFGKSIRPLSGIKAASVCGATSLAKMEKIQKISDPFRGVLVEEVVPESCAYYAGVCHGDHIVQCDGKTIKSPLEFDTMLLDKVGKSMELYVARIDEPTLLKITMIVDEISPDKFYSWPIPKKRMVTSA